MGRPQITYTLVSEALKKRFGAIFLDTTFQNKTRRVGFIRRVSDRAICTYHVVTFDRRGIRALGKYHTRIVAGGSLGEVIKRSGVLHQRSVSKPKRRPLSPVLAALFGTDTKYCRTEIITYRIRGIPYARIEEFYNPKFTLAD